MQAFLTFLIVFLPTGRLYLAARGKKVSEAAEERLKAN
jgi:hypothetical protein